MTNNVNNEITCIVFAGCRGLGASITNEFISRDKGVLVVCKDQQRFNMLVERLELSAEKMQRIRFLEADLDDRGSVSLIVDQCISLGFRPLHLIHNFGGTVATRTVDDSLEGWLECLWKNVFFSSSLNTAFVKNFELSKRLTRIVHVSSVSARHLMGSQVYSTSKALLNAYVRSNGRLVARKGIVQLAVAPGALNTSGGPWSKKSAEALSDFLSHYQLSGFLGAEATVSRLIYDLCGPAGDFCHGNIIECDGATI